MKRYLDVAPVLLFTLLTLSTLILNLGWVGGIISLIGIFIIPGWLLAHVLLGNNNQPDYVSRFILVFALSASLIALEMFGLSLFKIKISRESTILVGTMLTWLLLGVFIIRRRTVTMTSLRLQESVWLLLVPIIVVITLLVLLPLHQTVLQERYTEFYALPPSSEINPDNAKWQVVIINHERKTQSYTITCKNDNSPESLLLITSLNPETSQSFNLNSTGPDLTHKLRLNLYLEEVTTPYRWLEIIGTQCNALLTP